MAMLNYTASKHLDMAISSGGVWSVEANFGQMKNTTPRMEPVHKPTMVEKDSAAQSQALEMLRRLQYASILQSYFAGISY